MSEEIMMHLSSNSNQSDPSLSSKLAKLEARMAGKSSSSVQASWPSVSKPEGSDDVPGPSSSSDSDDNVVDDFLIQPHVNKRQKFTEQQVLVVVDQLSISNGRGQGVEDINQHTSSKDSKKVNGRGRGRPAAGRRRGSKACEQPHLQNSLPSVSAANGQIASEASHLPPEPTKRCPLCNQLTQEETSKKIKDLEEELSVARQELVSQKEMFSQLEKDRNDLKDFKEQEQQAKPKRVKFMSDLLISMAKAERQEARFKIRQDSFRLGNVSVMRAGTVISETWEDGQALKDVQNQLKNLWDAKEAVERNRKSLRKRQSGKQELTVLLSSDKGGDSSDHESSTEEDLVIQDEIFKSRLLSLKREEEVLLKEKERYELEKARHIRELKRIRDEDGSRFNNFQILNHRYGLLNLLGKGGFSEVYKAYDLVENRYVACKMHGLNAQWSEEKKHSYIRHAIREYNIHKTLVHPNIVRLWDTFEIDHNTFCTILEYCSGKDLDAVLKATPILPEKEARIVIVQIFLGLMYLNKRQQKIIHYDLKPGNVLFDEVGVAKMTDFGLSKIMDDDVGSQGMELTSQGAGTYWYLPPECFELNKTPLISSKVDVWSAGVLLYQMLFGKRPFGHEQTQERILREDTIIRARRVDFPAKPTVSNEAKDFIRRCLTYNQAERPDVLAIAQDPYLQCSKK